MTGFGRGVILAGLVVLGLSVVGCQSPSNSNAPVEQNMSEPTFRMIETNGVTLRVAEMGEGPLVILTHGWPELWYSWRYQMLALAAAGYHVIAPDMRGYGGSEAPEAIEAYNINEVTADLVGLIDAFGEEKATIVGHDWGAIIAWHSVLLHPDRYNGIVAMSVPYNPRGPISPIDAMRQAYGDNFFYIVYFQEPGVAEAEFDAQPREILKRLYAAPDTPRTPPEVTDPLASAGGWIPRLGRPTEHPDWFSEEDLDYYVSAYKNAGFRGGINYYRNFGRNWENNPQLTGAKIDLPVMFIAGAEDVVIRGADKDKLTELLSRTSTDLREVKLYENTGHWIQQEKADEINADLIGFLDMLHDK